MSGDGDGKSFTSVTTEPPFLSALLMLPVRSVQYTLEESIVRLTGDASPDAIVVTVPPLNSTLFIFPFRFSFWTI